MKTSCPLAGNVNNETCLDEMTVTDSNDMEKFVTEPDCTKYCLDLTHAHAKA